jgi:predicted house-cleaning noncanonical NTP pyrophosphatase (MazG superfamily)
VNVLLQFLFHLTHFHPLQKDKGKILLENYLTLVENHYLTQNNKNFALTVKLLKIIVPQNRFAITEFLTKYYLDGFLEWFLKESVEAENLNDQDLEALQNLIEQINKLPNLPQEKRHLSEREKEIIAFLTVSITFCLKKLREFNNNSLKNDPFFKNATNLKDPYLRENLIAYLEIFQSSLLTLLNPQTIQEISQCWRLFEIEKTLKEGNTSFHFN